MKTNIRIYFVSVDGKELGKGLYLPNGTDLRQVKVLRREEFDRIQDNLYKAERKKQQAINDYKEKQKLKKEAKEAIKNWPNTILVCLYMFLFSLVKSFPPMILCCYCSSIAKNVFSHKFNCN